jgi:polysaccharide export outer membrane protein
MKTIGKTSFCILVTALGLSLAGCNNKMLDPSQIGRFRSTPAVNVILDSLGVAEETPVAWENAEEPRPSDIVAAENDYVLQPADLVRISIFELQQEGITVVNDYPISETGRISIPDVGIVQAAGLTETQLEEEIRRVLTPGILRDPSVAVTLVSSQQRTFSILGDGVPRPDRYPIPRYDFRLTDALALAGGPPQFNVTYIYVSRREEAPLQTFDTTRGRMELPELRLIEPGSTIGPPRRSPDDSGPPGPSEPVERHELRREMFEMIAPSAANRSRSVLQRRVGSTAGLPNSGVAPKVVPYGFRHAAPSQTPQQLAARDSIYTPTEFGDPGRTRAASNGSERVEWVFQNGRWVPIVVTQGRDEQMPPTNGQIEWVLQDGQWVPARPGEQPTTPWAGPGRREDLLPVERQWQEAIQTRLIRIPVKELLAGDPRYNIIINPGDTIHVPVDLVGEFYIMGNVNNVGLVNITGRPMTLKMAIAAAGGLGPLAWPRYCEVTRRIGDRKEEIVMVDLEKIASGEQPDFFIKPNDVINVGTHPTSRWRAVLRNAFRATYGFGFVYDRNFAYSEDYYGTSIY